MFRYLFALLFSFSLGVSAQNEHAKWYFGFGAGVDFMTTPPTALLNNPHNISEGCATQSDALGNLLFYTSGSTVWDKTFNVMSNGNGLLGGITCAQSSLILKKPGSSSLYYIFTLEGGGQLNGLNYSIVDMTQAAGLGAVVAKNVPLYNASCTEKMTGIKHCNGKDYWIIIHEMNTNVFRSYLLTSLGVSSSAVTSLVGPTYNVYRNCMKGSPTGNKIASINYPGSGLNDHVELYDFNPSTGTLSNFSLITSTASYFYGVEFSPDGSKLYTLNQFGDTFHQWDLCAGSGSTIAISEYTLKASGGAGIQLAQDGKIYFAHPTSLSVVHNPNAPGAACNFSLFGLNLLGKVTNYGLPGIISEYSTVVTPFSYSIAPSIGCHAVSFAAHLPSVSCVASNFSVTNMHWDFGDPASGSLNTASLQNTSHIFSSSGNYTITLIYYYTCGSDTLTKVINIPPPDVSVTWKPTCNKTANATASVSSGVGPFTYTWLPSQQSGNPVNSLAAGAHTLTVYDQGLNCKVSATFSVSEKSLPEFSVFPSALNLCIGTSSQVTVKGNITNYNWQPSTGVINNGTIVTVMPVSTTQFTVIGEIDSCFRKELLNVSIFPSPTAAIVSNKSIFCHNEILELTGSGGEQYSWTGPGGFQSNAQSNTVVVQSSGDQGMYTLTVKDKNSCSDTASFKVILNARPEGNLTGLKTEGCVPFCSDLKFFAKGNNDHIQTNWSIGSSNFSDQFRFCFSEPGDYLIKGKVVDTISHCTNLYEYSVNVYPKPDADFMYSPAEPIESQNVVFSPSADNLYSNNWIFYFPKEQRVSWKVNSAQPQYSFDQAGFYTLVHEAQNQWGCVDTVIKNIRVEEDFSLYIPNSFSPNSDGRNDTFCAVIRGYSQFSLKIFNRWGELIFESSSTNDGWDGSYRNIPCKEDIYQFKISITTEKGKNIQKTGHVTLLR